MLTVAPRFLIKPHIHTNNTHKHTGNTRMMLEATGGTDGQQPLASVRDSAQTIEAVGNSAMAECKPVHIILLF